MTQNKLLLLFHCITWISQWKRFYKRKNSTIGRRPSLEAALLVLALDLALARTTSYCKFWSLFHHFMFQANQLLSHCFHLQLIPSGLYFSILSHIFCFPVFNASSCGKNGSKSVVYSLDLGNVHRWECGGDTSPGVTELPFLTSLPSSLHQLLLAAAINKKAFIHHSLLNNSQNSLKVFYKPGFMNEGHRRKEKQMAV